MDPLTHLLCGVLVALAVEPARPRPGFVGRLPRLSAGAVAGASHSATRRNSRSSATAASAADPGSSSGGGGGAGSKWVSRRPAMQARWVAQPARPSKIWVQ